MEPPHLPTEALAASRARKGRKCFSPVPRVSRPSLAGFDRAKVETELAQEAAAGLLRRDESAELFRAIGPSANNGG
jgi:hypothetical protein